MLVFHNNYQVDEQRFILWAESSEVRRGRQPALRPHPFAAPVDRLWGWLEHTARDRAPGQTGVPTVAGVYQFLKDAAPLLQANEFRVLLPPHQRGSKAYLSARAKVSSGRQTSPARLTIEALLHYAVEVMPGGELINRDEFRRLAALKQPLVRGQWVLLDTAQIDAGLKLRHYGLGACLADDMGLDGVDVPFS